MADCRVGADISLPSRMMAILSPMFLLLNWNMAAPPSLLNPKRIMGSWVSGLREGEALVMYSPFRPYLFSSSTSTSLVKLLPASSLVVSAYFL